jgi:hypothetical protein
MRNICSHTMKSEKTYWFIEHNHRPSIRGTRNMHNSNLGARPKDLKLKLALIHVR